MSRRSLLAQLTRYRLRHPDEGSEIDRIEQLVEAHGDCFERSCLPGHITGSSWIVSEAGDRCLLTHHRKLGRWLQLGGHADGDVDVAAVALREAREESGLRHFDPVVPTDGCAILDVDVHRIPARAGEPAHEHHDIRFLFRARAGQRLAMSEESNDLAWFEWERLAQIGADESMLRLARKARAVLSGEPMGATAPGGGGSEPPRG